jgi:PAS domain S-box-containing protein
LVFTRDVTKRQKAEEALKQSEDKYRSLVTRIPDITWTNTIKGEIVFISANVETVLGYSTESLHAKGPRVLFENIHPDDLNNFRQAFTALFEKNKPLDIDIEYRFRRIDGNWVWLRSRSGAIYEKDGVLCVDGLTSDITRHKEMAKEIRRRERAVAAARKMERLKSNLLSTVSHELRTPLASIKGYATMLLDYERRLKRDEKRSYLESIDRATNRLIELIDHLLDMSRLDAGLLRMARASTDINKLLDEAVSEAQMRSPEHRLRAEIKKELPTLNVDDRRIRQVVDNLLDNAIKYSQKGTEVVVRAAVRAQEVEISVTDQGRGIPASELGKVFDRMYRIEQRLAKDPGGLGLGLALCKALVEAHGGRIWLESEVEKGSIFFFTLPLGSKE